jgi:hypothetical protein
MNSCRITLHKLCGSRRGEKLKRRSINSFAFWLLIAAPSATFGQFSYPDFSSTTGLQLDGSASVVSDAIQLTVAGPLGIASAFWHTTPVNVRGGFSTTFSYTINPSGADGLAFVIQNDPNGPGAIGPAGDNLAASGISNGVAIAFRTYVFNDVEIDSCGVGNTISIGGCVVASIPDAGLGGTHTVRITESGGLLKVYLDGNQILSGAISLANAVGGNTAYVGITGADGSETETAIINSWSVTPGITPAVTPVPSSIWLTLVGLMFTAFWFGFRLHLTQP